MQRRPAANIAPAVLPLSLCLLVAAVLCQPLSAAAATKTWIDGTGQWDAADNWSPSGQPQAGDDVYLTQSDATDRTVTYYNTTNPNAVFNSLTIDATGTGTMTLDMPNARLLNVRTEYIGYSGKGAMTIQNGAQVSNTYGGYIGYNFHSTGTVSVTGANSTWTNNGVLHVGSYGSGTLNVEAGGQVSNTYGYVGYYSTGTAMVTGTGSKWTNSGALYVGNSGKGTLNIQAGGQVSNTDGCLGYNNGVTGTVTVAGAGSTWTNSGILYVGLFAKGILNIQEGGQVTSTYGSIGDHWTGSATVTGTGSAWTNSGPLYVSNSGKGTLTVADGGIVSTGTLFASMGNLLGNGTITAQGAVLDIDMVFDAVHGTTRTLPFGTGGILNLRFTSAGALGAGYKGTGTLKIADGITITSATGYLGYNSWAVGTATVTGAGSTWTNSGVLYVGYGGCGTLNIEVAGQVSNTDGYVGWPSGLNISTSTATVTGAGSRWTNSGNLFVGYYGRGKLNIEAGGQVSNNGCYLGYYSGSTGTVTVTGTGSTWTNTGGLYVGYDGNGALNVQEGGHVNNTDACLGYYSASTGTATVDGSGSAWNNTGSLYVGGTDTAIGGAGSVTVQNGGQLTVGGTLRLWKADSTVTVSDGTLTAATITNNGVLTVQSGGVATVTGDLTNSGSLTVNDAMLSATTITNSGTIRGRGDINGTITNNAGGIVAPGASPGILTVDAITFASGSSLQIELGGTARGTQYDVLAASGTVTLQEGSSLAVTLIDGFVPQGNDEFDILDFAGLSGEFGLSLPQLGTGLSWDTSDLYTGGTITVAPEPATLGLVAVGVAGTILRRRRK